MSHYMVLIHVQGIRNQWTASRSYHRRTQEAKQDNSQFRWLPSIIYTQSIHTNNMQRWGIKMTIVPILANPQFTKRYAWEDTVHEVDREICKEWHSSRSRLGRHSSQGGRTGTVYKVNLQVFKCGSFPVADIKGFGPRRTGWKTSGRYTSTTPTVVSSA